MATRPFFEVLRDLRSGLVIDELADQLQALVLAVESTNKAGTLTLQLHVSPLKGTDTPALVIRDEIKTKAPKHESKGTVLFATVEGNLQRQNPNQRELPGVSLASASH